MYAPHARMTSTAFLEAYRRCMDETASSGKNEAMFIPALVCAAFSAEVGLKALLLQAGKAARGHDLVRLFNRLPDELQLDIFGRMSMEASQFAANLNHVRDAFKDWRYMYEFNDERFISVAFVSNFAAAVAAANPLNRAAA
ncbi:HEPN domain-containing protein [Lysobacter cavernae]|uniref:HEPN domain-containing protein n=1 Tax=Lysobacter cavernae TaxID=1685901 RepID=A0ABV7RX02_9GAMM